MDREPSAPRLRLLSLHFYVGLPTNLFLPFFGLFFSLFLLTASPSVAVHHRILLFFTCSSLPLPVQSANHQNISSTRHSPASAARPYSHRRVPESATFTHYGALPPFPTFSCTQVPVIPSGVCLLWVPPRLCDPELPSLSSPPNPGIVLSLVSLLGGILHKGDKPGHL